MEIKVSIEQFIGIFPNAITDDLCSEFVNYFNTISAHGLTMSAMKQSGLSGIDRKDEVLEIPGSRTMSSVLPHDCFPSDMFPPLWQSIGDCYKIYHDEYNMDNSVDPLESHAFKFHRVQPSGGYHVWHHEQSYYNPDTVLVWHLTLEAPEEGGETEFLHQSMRVKPKVGQLVIWPAAFTHKHRGNPPLKGQKTYITGWFDLAQPSAGFLRPNN